MRFVILLLILTLAASAATAQRVVAFAQDTLVLVDRAMQDIEPHSVSPSHGFVATDGLHVAWMTHHDATELGRLDLHTGNFITVPTAYRPRGVAMTADGGVVVVQSDGLGMGYIERFDALGASQWLKATDPAPALVAVDRLGQIWVTHGIFDVDLTRHDENGTLLSRHPLSPFPVRIEPSPLGYVWVLCAFHAEVFGYGETGDLAVRFLGGEVARDFAVDPFGDLLFANGATGQAEYRGPVGAYSVPTTLPGSPDIVAFDPVGTLWTASNTGVLSSLAGAMPQTTMIGLGPVMDGDWTGRAFHTCAGRDVDTDGDGVPNGLEIEAGTDSLDAVDVPMGIDLLSSPVAGGTVPMRIRSTPTPNGLYWLAASGSELPVGAGPLGLPLVPDDVFAAFQANWAAHVHDITAALDNLGEDLNLLHLPVASSGESFYLAFLALDLRDFEVIPSPPQRIDVP